MSNTKFINSLFLKNLIESHYDQKDVKIKSYSVEDASENTSGNTTRSSINRLLVKYSSRMVEEDVVTFVTKIKPTKNGLAEEYKISDDFVKEIAVYKSVLPAMITALKKVGEKVEFTPKVVLLINIPTDGLVMEEVNNRGYHVQFEKTGLNLVQSKLALQKLAYFHAASVILQTTSADFKKFSKGTFHTDFKDKLNFFEDAYKIAVDNATELGVSSSIKNKLKEMMPIALPKVIEDYTSSMKDFKVLNHGDFFTKNIFFKYNKNELVDVLFVDFQNCVIGSPIIDLFYFLTTSVAYEIYSVVRDELIYTYHETLTAVLNKFNYQGYVPTLNELQIEMVKRGMLELYLQLTVGAYIRTPSPRVTPAVQPLLYKQEYLQELKDHGKTVLGMFKPFFIEQLHHFDLQGTLDYKGDSKRVSGIKGRWSGKF